MKIENESILFISAHSDDVEGGCGGTIARLIHSNDIFHVVFSFAVESIPSGFDEDSTRKELLESMKILGIPTSRTFCFDYPVRNFPSHRQEILEGIIKIRDSIKPTVIFTHSLNDMHQDHKVIAEESFRAFKDGSSIFSYGNIWNLIRHSNNLTVELEKEHVEKKMEALGSYKSQLWRERYSDEVVYGQAVVEGLKINTKFAESFEVVRMRMGI